MTSISLFPAGSVVCLEPRCAEANRKLGWALAEEGRLDEALASYHRAQKLEPDSALAYLQQGVVHEELGQFTEAESAYRSALRVQPAFTLGLGRLATLLRGKLSDADRTALETCLAEPNLAKGPRARLLFGLAHVRDARGDYAGAVACLRDANALVLELNRDRCRSYDPADHEIFIDQVLEACAVELFRRTAGGGLTTRRPVFIVGLPRSGTTLVEQILASHPQIHGAGELRYARQTFESMADVMKRCGPPVACLGRLDARGVRRLAQAHHQQLRKLGGQALRVVDKMPDNYLYLGLLAAMFPQATFIHCRRDLRDVAVSCWMTDFRTLRWANDRSHIGHRFGQYRRLMAHWRRILPVPVHEVAYEETIAGVEGVARRLVAACGLDWHPACVEFHRTQRPVATASVVQVRQPLYQRSRGRWRNYQSTLADLFACLPGD